jgi:hypothetical protein
MGIQGDWGQGAANNDIYWGQAAATNSISWGMVQPLSYGHPTTNLYGTTSKTAWNLIAEIWNTWDTTWNSKIMGTTLTGTTPQDTYDSLIKVTDNGPLSGTAKYLSDGLGNDSALALSTGNIGIGTTSPSTKLHVNWWKYDC